MTNNANHISGLPGNEVKIRHYPFDLRMLSSLIHSVPLSIYAKDINGTFIFANLYYCKSVGKELKDILGKTDYDIHPGDLAEKYLADDQMIITSRETRIIEESWKSIGGTTHYVQVIKTPLIDNLNPDTVLGTIGVFWDITEKKKTEILIQEERTLLRTLIDSIPALVYVKDISGRFLIANRAISEFMGADSPDELIGKSDFDFYPENIAQTFYNAEKEIINSEEPLENVIESFTLKDKKYWLNTSKKPLRNLAGEVIGIVGVGHDITDIKEIELKLRESEERYAAVVQQAVEGIYLIDPETKKVLESNESFQKMLGYSPEELCQCLVYDFVLHSREDVNTIISRVISQKDYIVGNRKYRLKNGSIVDVEVSAKLIQYGEKKAIVIIVRDISEKILAEKEKEKLTEQLRQAQKLEAIGTLAGGVAHDLNNILAGIVSYPEMMLVNLPDKSPYREPLNIIQESGQRAAAVVADLLTVARGVASPKEVHAINTLLSEQLESPEYKKLQSRFPHIEYEVKTDPQAGNISCSPVHVKKSVMNLIINAAEAINGNGIIQICTGQTIINEEYYPNLPVASGKYFTITIHDSGQGISKEDIAHIFEPFYTQKKMGSSGSGLGLTVVWNTMLDHKGAVTVENSTHGAIFTLFFPVTHHELYLENKNSPILDLQGNGKRILVVDDEVNLRNVATQMLSELGYTVFSCSSGEEAIEFVQGQQVDLLVLDMIMDPGINGYQTYSRILQIHPKQKSVIVSGFSESEDVLKAQRLGAGKLIKKPYTLQTLGKAVKQELTKHD